MALCFIVYTVYVMVRLLTSAYNGGGGGIGGVRSGGSDGVTVWAFAGASIAGADGNTMTATAWAAACSVAFLVATLGLWSTLLAGNGRTQAVKVALARTATKNKTDKVCMAKGKRGDGRRPTMGWGDPGTVIMSPKEDMKVLVEGVVAKVGPPEARKICQTCLVRKPIRSKVRCVFFDFFLVFFVLFVRLVVLASR